MNPIEIATCTMSAAHRRDHRHGIGAGSCHPHAIEVIHLEFAPSLYATTAERIPGSPARDAMRVATEHQTGDSFGQRDAAAGRCGMTH